ncbi:MAG: glycosyltransferase [Acidobacteria bacterium]|nr:glycosyltransferase [Acidobacteriota bacterium]
MGRLRVAVLWSNFGPYHMARLTALNEVCDVVAIQIHGREDARGWDRVAAPPNLKIRTLLDGLEQGGHLSLAPTIWQTLSEANPAAVLVPGYAEGMALTAAVWAKLHRRPALLMNESTMGDRPRRAWAERCKRQLVRALYDGAVVGGVRSAAYTESLGVERTKIGYGHNVVDNAYFAEGCARIRRDGPPAELEALRPYFLYVGRLAAEKNLMRLLEAFAIYRRGGGNWNLMLAGGGPAEGELKKKADEEGVTASVRFMGARPPAALLQCYAWAECLVLPSWSEPWGLVVNEAMAAGLPALVSNRCGCVDDLIEQGGNGWLFEPGDVGAITDCLWKMTRLDSTARKAMGERSTTIIAGYTPQRFAQEVSRLLCAPR